MARLSESSRDPDAGPSSASRWRHGLAWALALIGLATFEFGQRARAAATPPGLAPVELTLDEAGHIQGASRDPAQGAHRGPSQGAPRAVEHRSPPLSRPLEQPARAGRGARAIGVGLVALALALALGSGLERSTGAGPREAEGPAGLGRARRAARLLWVAPGALGVWRLQGVASTGEGDAGEAALLVLLSLCLLAAWRE